MKKRNYITYQALTAVTMMATALLGTSCATDRTFLEDDEVPIRMAVACQEMTRGTSGASSQETAFDADAKINVTITTSDATPVSICNGSIFTASAPSGGTNTLTPPDPTRPPYYPNGDKTVTIKAFYPSTVNTGTTSFAVQTDQTTVSTTDETADTYKKSDLMTATVTGQVKTASDVNLQFQHRMAKITISATATDGLTIQSINLANVQTTASYASATDSWSGSGSTGTITVATAEASEKLTTLSGVALFPSQAIEGKTFIQVVTNKGTANYAVTSKLFQESYDYTANLEVGLQNLSMTAAITEWNVATGSATVIKLNKNGVQIKPITEKFTYDGNPKIPTSLTVINKTGENEEVLQPSQYTLEYFNNINVGTALVVAYYGGDAAVQSYLIGQKPCTMYFESNSVSAEYEEGGKLTNELKDKGDGTFTWTSSNESVATVNADGEVTKMSDGTTIIRASMAGDGNYEAATAEYTLTITKRNVSHVTIQVGDLAEGFTYSGRAKTPGVVITDNGKRLSEGTDYTVGYSNNIDVGTATITITGAGKYDPKTYKTATFNITKAQAVITMSTTATTIGVGETYDCGATTNYGNITYTMTSGSTNTASLSVGGIVTGKADGTVTITASVAAGTNYEAATSKSVTVKVETLETVFEYTGTTATYTCTVDNAVYTFELIGGAGGCGSNGKGGKGGIVKASKVLPKGTVIYINVAGGGTSTAAGWNGGGAPAAGGGTNWGGGGGGTDIRIGGGEIANRVLVAGGGGGASGSRSGGRDGGNSSSGNNGTLFQGTNNGWGYGGGGGGGYYGGMSGSRWGGGYGGSNYIDSTWTVIKNDISTNGPPSGSDTNVYNGKVTVSYKYE